ncbi:MAG: hypothetical protein NZV14_17935 [Bryobacteraceae bacterium]|nr:hypothetical protein [Bryobacteraceae bacterium]MDW8380045.1 hypothetical protein [Bryobacterales bacterium]
MRLKSYYSSSIEAAIRQARLELGEEAMLVEARKAPAEAQHLGEHEVIFAVPADSSISSQPGSWSQNPAGLGFAKNDAGELRYTSGDRVAFGETHFKPFAPAAPASGPLDEDLEQLFDSLVREDFPREISRHILHHCRPSAPVNGASKETSRRETLQEVLAARIRVEPPGGASGGPLQAPRIAFVGPPAAGKTTSLIKLAIRFGLATGRRLQILSLDNLRVAASEQLRTIGAIVGVQVQEVEHLGDLRAHLQAASEQAWLWIDTPGFGPRDGLAMEELAAALARLDDVETHLVVPATMRSAEMMQICQRYACFRPDKLLVTHLDEAICLGSIFTAMAVTERPVCFFSTGQQIPEDLEPASAKEILERTLNRFASHARARQPPKAYATAG